MAPTCIFRLLPKVLVELSKPKCVFQSLLNAFSALVFINLELNAVPALDNRIANALIWFPGIQHAFFKTHLELLQFCWCFVTSPRAQIELPKPPTKPKCIFIGLLNALSPGFNRSTPSLNPKI